MSAAARAAAGGGLPALYPCTITHVRTAPVRHRLRHRTYLWLIDPDRPPRPRGPFGMLARFEGRDHFGPSAGTLRAKLDSFLASRGVDLDGGRVLMLAHARVLGFVFNPLTLYWCHGPDGALRCVVAEVHNTYGERHCYLLHPGEDQVAEVRKEFYVSPFFPVDGSYRMRLPEPGAALDLTIRLDRSGERPFVARVTGERRPASPSHLARLAVRHPLSTVAVALAIRVHGIRLFLRGLPIRDRPAHPPQEGVR
ncbi:hypothetical protein SLNWT_3158 [Streptomyces albus]|uniref:DUF1365 domain-containing protein n=1 Tax=Streptomyces albus (strain ATCC 21838 / DSM 41398 / FERM P-419 / JCM 4703 / NBRC 107858) TaxID=1081613 RepID=A0A0B5EPM6_STRA4|nr:hypothetical protein SLNWT_3158 [Streptomyces albus]AOU77842.1 hypothetical protein SLNHY_3151 [Streptomyces albus]AYN33602.1 hypothetical protein DUI70_3101 [Streptomyces albus]